MKSAVANGRLQTGQIRVTFGRPRPRFGGIGFVGCIIVAYSGSAYHLPEFSNHAKNQRQTASRYDSQNVKSMFSSFLGFIPVPNLNHFL